MEKSPHKAHKTPRRSRRWCVTATFGALPGLDSFLPCSRPGPVLAGPEVGHGDEGGPTGEMVLGGCVWAGSTATSTSVVKQRSLGSSSCSGPSQMGSEKMSVSPVSCHANGVGLEGTMRRGPTSGSVSPSPQPSHQPKGLQHQGRGSAIATRDFP